MKPTVATNKPNQIDGSDDINALCKSWTLQLPTSKRTRISVASILFILFTTKRVWHNLIDINEDFHYHHTEVKHTVSSRPVQQDFHYRAADMEITHHHNRTENDAIVDSVTRVAQAEVNHSVSSRPSNFLMYVMTLQGVKGAGKSNAGRYDEFQRHWKILCHDDPQNSRQQRIHFRRCPGYITPKSASAGFGLSMAFLDCFQWALKHHKQWHKDQNPNAKGLDDDSIPFVFLEDDARLYNPNFCDSEYRNRLWQNLPQKNLTLLMLGGHSIGFYNTKHPIAKEYQDHYYNETILMDPSVLPQFFLPRRGHGSYGFVLLNTPTVEYMTRKIDKMLNRTISLKGRGFKAIDQQFHEYTKLKTYMSYPWLVYHEGGIYSNTKGVSRGEFGDGSKQYRWIAGLTGSAKNCTGNDNRVDDGANEQARNSKHSMTSDHNDFEEGSSVISCRIITFRIPYSFSWKSNSTFGAEKKIPIAIVSRSNHSDMRASIRSTWGNGSGDKFFLVAGPWQEIVTEFQEYGDLIWINLPENGSGHSDNDDNASTMLSSLQVASFLNVAETKYGDDYSHILKVSDHSYANLGAIRSQLVDNHKSIAMWGNQCKTGVRPHHVGVPMTEYSDYFFPQYCKGVGYALSKLFVRCAVEQIPQSTLISLDDAYIGILGERCGLQENQFHSGADVENGKMPLLQHDLETSAAMEKHHAKRDSMIHGTQYGI